MQTNQIGFSRKADNLSLVEAIKRASFLKCSWEKQPSWGVTQE